MSFFRSLKKEKDYSVEFLPSALEIIEKPESPLGKYIIWTVFLVVLSTIIWSVVGRIDEVAVAQGKIIPSGDVKVIQSLESGVVTAIHVEEGAHIKKGDKLIDLDTDINHAELTKQLKILDTLKVERALIQAIVDGNDSTFNKLINQNKHLTLDSELISRQKYFKELRGQDQGQKQSALSVEIEKSKTELEISKSQLKQIEIKISSTKDQLKIMKELYENGSESKSKVTELESELDLATQQYQQQQTQIKLSENQIKSSETAMVIGDVSFQKQLVEEIIEKDKAIQELEKDVEKMKKRLSFQTVIAPVDGIVLGVGTNTIGGVVSSEKPIVTIVPDDTPLIVEAMVLNKDIGFIHKGQKVDIKLDTFPFQKYGSIDGVIESISPDAIEDEKQGYVYRIKVRPEVTKLKVGEKWMSISPGMTVQAEVKTGNRRIIEFFIPGLEEIKDGFELR